MYHTYFTPLEWRVTYPRHAGSECYAKLIVRTPPTRTFPALLSPSRAFAHLPWPSPQVHTADAGRIVGLHVCAPHAGEMTQGFAVAMRAGATKDDFDTTVGHPPRACMHTRIPHVYGMCMACTQVGIHPTMVEVFTTMGVTKRSGASPKSKTC